MVGNAVAVRNGLGHRFSAGKSADKIDGVVAVAMALGRAMLAAEDPKPGFEWA